MVPEFVPRLFLNKFKDLVLRAHGLFASKDI